MSGMTEYIVALIALSFMVLTVGIVFSLSVIRKVRSEETRDTVRNDLFSVKAQIIPIRTIAVPARLHHELTTTVSQNECSQHRPA